MFCKVFLVEVGGHQALKVGPNWDVESEKRLGVGAFTFMLTVCIYNL